MIGQLGLENAMHGRMTRGQILQQLSHVNKWWAAHSWEDSDVQLQEAARAPYRRQPDILADIIPPNLYTLRGPRRVGKSTVLKQSIVRLCHEGIDPHRICYFSADSMNPSVISSMSFKQHDNYSPIWAIPRATS